MEHRIREYVEELFSGAPQNRQAVELREEMLQNLVEKYRDLLAQGYGEESAYGAVIAGIGDVDALLRDLQRRESPEEQAARKRSALFTAVAVMLYILCILPVLLLQDVAGVVLMFVMIAAATGLLIYNSMSKPSYRPEDDSMVEEFRAWKAQKAGAHSVRKSIHSAVWAIAVAVFFILSFSTRLWGVTWVVFLIAGAVNGIVDAIFELSAQRKERK